MALDNLSPHHFCLGSFPRDFTSNDSNEVSLIDTVYDLSTDYGLIGTENTTNIDQYLMKKNNLKQ